MALVASLFGLSVRKGEGARKGAGIGQEIARKGAGRVQEGGRKGQEGSEIVRNNTK